MSATNYPSLDRYVLTLAKAATPSHVALAARSSSGQAHSSSSQSPLRLSVDTYAYSFWRSGSTSTGLAAGGQYGGGQSGVIATIRLRHTDQSGPPKLALLIRAAVAHSDTRDRELGLGVRWQPKTDWPVSVSVERRLRNLSADSFALYVAGGRGDIQLPARFKLETYAQGGVVSGRKTGLFFDAQAKADRRILPQSPLSLHAGVGIWAGGQSDTSRLDIGPSLRTELPLAHTRIRITADWRFRIAGNASPGNGPALTLSTGF